MGMKIEAYLFLGVALLFALTDAAYWYFSRDPIGTTALGLSVGLGIIIGFFTFFSGKNIGERAEDNPDAEIAEGAGQFGFYAPKSWWPLWVGGSAALTGLGVAIVWWLALVGLCCLFLSTIGMVFEFYRGVYSH